MRVLALMKMLFLVLPLALLASCGGDGPTTEPDEAASAQAINASVNKAANVAEAAQEEAEAEAGE